MTTGNVLLSAFQKFSLLPNGYSYKSICIRVSSENGKEHLNKQTFLAGVVV